MTPAKPGLDLIKSFEQCRLQAYLPTPNDVPTIGWGTTGPDIHMGLVWTQQQADDRFAADVSRFAASVSALLGICPTTQNQFDAMVSLAYNIGAQHFATSTVLREHKLSLYSAAAAAFLLWNKQAGIVLKGLVRRRQAEAALYLTP